jgi:hypothetical protein
MLNYQAEEPPLYVSPRLIIQHICRKRDGNDSRDSSVGIATRLRTGRSGF